MTTLNILGAAGRMGRMLIATAAETPDVSVTAATEISTSPTIGQDAGVVAGIGPLGTLITDHLSARPADIVIDFTFHAAVAENLRSALKYAKGYVIGTTGLTAQDEEEIKAAARSIPIVKGSNMSLGVNLIIDLVRRAAAILNPSYDIEIVEMHHRLKKDSPSGTALELAKAAAKGRNVALEDVAIYGREGMIGERPQGQIAIHALRGGDVVGDHTVIFAADGERVEITHKASSRANFAKGAMLAARWLGEDRKPGVYTMRDVLGLGE